MHLPEHLQIIFFIIDRRISQLFVIIPAYSITAVAGAVAVSDAVVSDSGRKEIKTVPFISELSEHVIAASCGPVKQIRDIFLQVRIHIERCPIFQNRGEIIIGGDNVRKVVAGQCGSVLFLRQINIADFHIQQILKILPHTQLVHIDVACTVTHIADRQDHMIFCSGRIPQGENQQG